MKKLLITLSLILFLASMAYAQDYFVYVRTYDRSGVTKDDDAGRSKAGDVVAVLPDIPQFQPSETEKKEYLILKVKDLSEASRKALVTDWADRDADGHVIAKYAYRKSKIDFATLTSSKEGVIDKTSEKATKIMEKVSEKTSADLKSYETKRIAFLYLQRPFEKLARFVLPYAWASTVTSTINKSGEDYNTLTLWEDAKDGDLVTATTLQEADVYNDDGDLSDSVTIDGSTCNSSYYMFVTAPSGERHTGTAGTGACVTYNFGSGGGSVIICKDSFSRVTWLEIKVGATGNATNANGVYLGDNGVETCLSNMVANCVIYPSDDYGSDDDDFSGVRCTHHNNGGNYLIYNNIIYGFNQATGRGIFLRTESDGRHIWANIYNNIITDCVYGIDAYSTDGGSVRTWSANNLVTNCSGYCYDDAHVNANGDFYNSGIANLSDDGTCFYYTAADSGACDSNTENHLIDSDQNFLTTVKVGMRVRNTTDSTWGYVTAVNSNSDLTLDIDICPDGDENYTIYNAYVYRTISFAGANNFHLSASDTDAIDLGSDLGATNGVNIDIDGRDRDAEGDTWDIGADEFTVAATVRRMFLVN